MKIVRLLPLALLAVSLFGTTAMAQDAGTPGALSIEMNDLAPSEKGCKLTFVAGNGLPQSLSKVSFEFVLFDAKGLVERMAVLDFRDLPAGKTKVRQFDLPGTKCEAVKSLLINDAPVCAGDGVAKDACMKALKTGSKSPVELKG
ncbi:hypothetical protein [Pararhizobium sp.]|uniref:hypothetical protein n=1 Tax=Pararhizobium sp. TaxID=1977563 RepID=UPI003D13D033